MLVQGAKQLSLGPACPFDGTPVRGPGAHRHQGHWCGGTEEENQPPEPRHVREAPNGKREYDQAPSNQRNQGPPTEQSAGCSTLSRIFGGHNKDDTNHPQRQAEALTSRRRRPAAALPSVGAFDDLFEG